MYFARSRMGRRLKKPKAIETSSANRIIAWKWLRLKIIQRVLSERLSSEPVGPRALESSRLAPASGFVGVQRGQQIQNAGGG